MEEGQKSSSSNSPKGHGHGKQVKPGANVCPPGAGKGKWIVKGDPLKQKIRSGK